MESLSAITDSGDPPGWIAEGCYRIIDSRGSVFTATYEDGEYSFAALEEHVSDDELRDLMLSNLASVRQPSAEYSRGAQELSNGELFAFTYRWMQRTPDMSPQLRALGCTAIILLCLLAAGIPMAIMWWLLV